MSFKENEGKSASERKKNTKKKHEKESKKTKSKAIFKGAQNRCSSD